MKAYEVSDPSCDFYPYIIWADNDNSAKSGNGIILEWTQTNYDVLTDEVSYIQLRAKRFQSLDGLEYDTDRAVNILKNEYDWENLEG